MIQIHRPNVSPPVLEAKGLELTQSDCDAYDACPYDYKSGKAAFPSAKSTHYSYPAVKELLLKMHHNKCCYCEMKFRDPLLFDVEHFRPKNGVRQAVHPRKHELPGYYWLKFRWDNLLLSCVPCNRSHKDTCFPLEDPLMRARSHHDDLMLERPLLVDPVKQDPRCHIHFVDDNPVADTPQGEMTITVLALRRDELKGDRRDYLDRIRKSYQALQLAKEYSDIAEFKTFAEEEQAFIIGAMRSDSKFSSMVIDYVAQHPL